MRLDTIVDKLTPCLIEASSGKICPTVFAYAEPEDITALQERGWLFDWTAKELERTNIYKLMIKDDDTIQGLVSTEIIRGAVHVHLTESAPHNLGENKQYEGVGGHLFAIAMRLSMSLGFGGYIFFDAKNLKLVGHYIDKLGANRIASPIHEYRMEVQEEKAAMIIDEYTMEGDLHVI